MGRCSTSTLRHAVLSRRSSWSLLETRDHGDAFCIQQTRPIHRSQRRFCPAIADPLGVRWRQGHLSVRIRVRGRKSITSAVWAFYGQVAVPIRLPDAARLIITNRKKAIIRDRPRACPYGLLTSCTAILDKNAHIPQNATIGYDLDADGARGWHVTDSGILAGNTARYQWLQCSSETGPRPGWLAARA